MKVNKSYIYRFLIIWLTGFVFVLAGGSDFVLADLPPRPTTPSSSHEEPTTPPPAGTLILHTQPPVDGLWSVVQWQDKEERWHDVEGWRGTVVNGKTIWWVEEGHWGHHPYRWVILSEPNGDLLAHSGVFTLPSSGETLVVDVAISE